MSDDKEKRHLHKRLKHIHVNWEITKKSWMKNKGVTAKPDGKFMQAQPEDADLAALKPRGVFKVHGFSVAIYL